MSWWQALHSNSIWICYRVIWFLQHRRIRLGEYHLWVGIELADIPACRLRLDGTMDGHYWSIELCVVQNGWIAYNRRIGIASIWGNVLVSFFEHLMRMATLDDPAYPLCPLYIRNIPTIAECRSRVRSKYKQKKVRFSRWFSFAVWTCPFVFNH